MKLGIIKMEMFYYADSPRKPDADIQELNEQIFGFYDEWGGYFNTDNDEIPEHMRIITDEEFITNELENI